jgi:glyoxylase-like metal-dependent hydrolase (beta-lactamase superfamily II)
MSTPMPAVHRIRRFGAVNAYLVREDDGLTLVDALVPGSAPHVLAAAAALRAPVTRIALTHAHGDHVGSLDALAAALPGAEVSASARDARLLAGDRAPEPGEPADARLRGGLHPVATRPGRLLSAGDRVGSLEVVAAPGHTPGHVAFFDPRDGTLYCGDAYSTLFGVATTARVYPWFPLPSLFTWHRPTALASARALRALGPARLAPGHGPVVERPGAAMDAAVARGV